MGQPCQFYVRYPAFCLLRRHVRHLIMTGSPWSAALPDKTKMSPKVKTSKGFRVEEEFTEFH